MKGLIILDFNRTLYDSDSSQLLDDALDFLKDYNKVYSLALIGKGDEKRASLINDLDIKKYFKYIKLKEKKEVSDFIECLKELKFDRKDVWSIGDRIKKEIVLSNQIGIKTIWLKNGKFSNELPSCEEEKPTFTASSFKEIRKIIPL